MIKNKLFLKNIIQKKYLNHRLNKKFLKSYPKIIKDIKDNIDDATKIYNVLGDNFKFNFKFQDLKKFKKFNTIALIGIGGSILGSEAIYDFLKKKIKKEIFFFDNIDEQKILNFKKKVNTNKTLFIVISKSGDTIETLSNFLYLNIVNNKNVILISEKNNNALYAISKRFNFYYIEHKNFIGGRYSVLSEAGIVPAYLMGVNINKLRKNLNKFLIFNKNSFLRDNAVKLANILHQKKISNSIFINYIPELEKFLFWCQQLIAESLGKKGKGFFPVISSAPKDHHSLLQLYLDGPKDKIFNIFSIDQKSTGKLNTKKFTNKINFLHNKNFNKIKIAQKDALIKALKEKQIPFREFKIQEIDEETLGKLFSYFILETIIVGKLIRINPFDQPAVEQVKKYTKKFLN